MTVSWWPTVRGRPLPDGEPALPVEFGSFALPAGLDPTLWVAILERSGLPNRNGREYLKLSALGMGKTETSAGTR